MPAPEHDFLIIGQGLAGTILAHTLIEQGQRVMVLDNHHAGCSTKVAAGIINPITGHRLNLTERFGEYYPIAQSTYKKLEQSLGQPLWRDVKQSRLIKNAGQADFLQKRLSDPSYSPWLRKSDEHHFASDQYGSINIVNTAAVDTSALLRAGKSWLKSIYSYQNTQLNYDAIQPHQGVIQAANFSATSIIFCEGYQAINNPWLKDLPFKLAKGEILTVEAKQPIPDCLLNWGNWLLPGHYRNSKQALLGSSYAWNDVSLSPDPATQSALLSSLEKQTNIRAKAVQHKVGIRPTTSQREPFVGPLSNLSHAYCFNGFGSKGCLLVPYYAEQLCAHVLKGDPLPEEVTRWL